MRSTKFQTLQKQKPEFQQNKKETSSVSKVEHRELNQKHDTTTYHHHQSIYKTGSESLHPIVNMLLLLHDLHKFYVHTRIRFLHVTECFEQMTRAQLHS